MKTIITLLAMTVLSSGVIPVRAATLTVNLKSNYYNAVSINFNGNNENVYAGTLSSSFTGGPSGYPTSFDTYCVDLSSNISIPATFMVNLQSISGLNNGGAVGWLYDHYGTNKYGAMVSDANHASALQIAIWEVITDPTYNLTTGNFKYTTPGDITNYANTYLANLGSNTDNAGYLYATIAGPNGKQSMVGPDVPEPGIITMLLSSLVGITLFTRKRLATTSK